MTTPEMMTKATPHKTNIPTTRHTMAKLGSPPLLGETSPIEEEGGREREGERGREREREEERGREGEGEGERQKGEHDIQWNLCIKDQWYRNDLDTSLKNSSF